MKAYDRDVSQIRVRHNVSRIPSRLGDGGLDSHTSVTEQSGDGGGSGERACSFFRQVRLPIYAIEHSNDVMKARRVSWATWT